MNTQTQEALHKALKVLNCLNNDRVYETAWVKGAINACEEALEQPAQEIGDAEIKQMLDDIEYYQKRVEELEQPAQEPVAYLWLEHGKPRNAFLHEPMQYNDDGYWTNKGFSYKPLYTNPAPAREPLSEEKLCELADSSWEGLSPHADTMAFARAIEKAHGIGEQA